MHDPEPGREPDSHPESTTAILLGTAALLALAPATLYLAGILWLLLAFVFAWFENALLHFSRVRLMDRVKAPEEEAAFDAILVHEDEIYLASKIARGLTQVLGIALLGVAVAEQAGDDGWKLAGWSIALAILFLLVNVAAPFVLGRRYGDALLFRALVPYAKVLVVVRPVANAFQRIAARLTGAGPEPDPTDEITDDILSAVEEGTREGRLDAAEKQMIQGVIDLREVAADHIMTPRIDLVALQVDTTVEDAIAQSQARGLSRLPVYRDTPDEIIGILYLKDLLPYLGREAPPVARLLRKPFFIPQSKSVSELLQEMRARQIHLAVVLDEYGGTAGIATIEDILEEIVGEIADEHEGAAANEIVKVNANVAVVDGRTHIDDLNKSLGLEVPESEEYETVGGLIFCHMGRVPHQGESYELDGVRFTVVDADERRIHRAKVAVKRV